MDLDVGRVQVAPLAASRKTGFSFSESVRVHRKVELQPTHVPQS